MNSRSMWWMALALVGLVTSGGLMAQEHTASPTGSSMEETHENSMARQHEREN